MSFPVVVKTKPECDPPGRLYYEVASNGVFQVKETDLYRSVTRAEEIPGLCPQVERLEIRFPRLPAQILEDVQAFFCDVYDRYRAEAIVVLFYRSDTQQFRVEVPPQTIPGYRDWSGQWRSYLRLDYGSVARPAGFVRFGTIHSHAELTAYASATDCHDERFEDGLHVVYGHCHSSGLSRSASFVANGTRFELEPDDVLQPCRAPERIARPDWLARVSTTEDPKIVGAAPASKEIRSEEREYWEEWERWRE